MHNVFLGRMIGDTEKVSLDSPSLIYVLLIPQDKHLEGSCVWLSLQVAVNKREHQQTKNTSI